MRTYTVQYRDRHGLTQTTHLAATDTADRRTTVALYVDPRAPERIVHTPPPTRAGAVAWALLALGSALAALGLPVRVWRCWPAPAALQRPARRRRVQGTGRTPATRDDAAIQAALDALDLPAAD